MMTKFNLRFLFVLTFWIAIALFFLRKPILYVCCEVQWLAVFTYSDDGLYLWRFIFDLPQIKNEFPIHLRPDGSVDFTQCDFNFITRAMMVIVIAISHSFSASLIYLTVVSLLALYKTSILWVRNSAESLLLSFNTKCIAYLWESWGVLAIIVAMYMVFAAFHIFVIMSDERASVEQIGLYNGQLIRK